MPTSPTSSSMSCSGSIPTMAGVPLSIRRMPGAGVYVGPIRNGSVAPIQPWIGWVISSRSRSATYANAGAPGPPLRYL